MRIESLSDSETARHSYAKELGQFLENGLVAANIPEGRQKGLKKQEEEPKEEAQSTDVR